MPGNQKKTPLAEFSFDEQGRIISCPMGISPENVKLKKGAYSAAFSVASCSECPNLKECPVSKGKKAYYYRYKEKDIRIANRRRYEQSDAFKERYRFRAGVEATMSEFDRRTGVKHLRVRGIKAVSFAVVMKAIGLNILRADRFKRRNNITNRTTLWHSPGFVHRLFLYQRAIQTPNESIWRKLGEFQAESYEMA